MTEAMTTHAITGLALLWSMVNLYVSTKHVGRIEAAAQTFQTMKERLAKIPEHETRIGQIENFMLANTAESHKNSENHT